LFTSLSHPGHQEDVQKVSEVSTTSKTSQKPLETSENLENLNTYLETHVAFCGNLLKNQSMETCGNPKTRKPT
jgi:hypothetical protein